jgi:WXG100 family type VII secretion target
MGRTWDDSCDIEVNIDILKSTINTYEKSRSDLHSLLCKLESELTLLDSFWEGDGKKAFDDTFPGFYASMMKNCDMIDELKNELSITLTQFESLDSEIAKLDPDYR